MSDLTWQFELTSERVPHLRVQLEWALQRQQRRFVAAFVAGFERARRIIGFTGAGIGLLALGLIAAIAPSAVRDYPWQYGGLAVAFALAFVMLFRERRIAAAASGSRKTGESIERDAERVFARLEKSLPYTIDYTLTGDRVDAKVPKLGIDRSVELRRAGIVIVATDALFVFRRRTSVTPKRFVYLTPEARTTLLALLARDAVEHEIADGPVEGYVAPIARASITR